MKLSHTSAYAVQALIHMASQGDGRLSTAEAIAEAHGSPRGVLLKALTRLVRVGLLRSLGGPHGGYRLARPASKLTLLEIVEAVDGPLQSEGPPISNASGAPLNRRLDVVCAEAARLTRETFGKVTVAELVKATGAKGPDRKAKG